MTLPERLARNALPCRWPGAYADKCTCEQCERRVDVEDAIREAIEACAERCYHRPLKQFGTAEPPNPSLHVSRAFAGAIRALLTDE